MQDLFEIIDQRTRKYETKYRNNLRLVCAKFIVFFINNLFKNLFKFKKTKEKSLNEPIKLGVYMSGGLGDALISLNYIYYLKKYLANEDVLIDIYFEKKIFTKFVEMNNFINKYYIGRTYNTEDYDVFFRLIRYPFLYTFDKKFVKTKSLKLFNLLERYEKFIDEHRKVILQEPRYDSIGKDIALANDQLRLQQPDIDGILGIPKEYGLPIEVNNIEETLKKFDLQGVKFITLNRGVGTKLSASPKLWSLENYNSLIKMLKEKYPDYKLIQIGDTNSTFGMMEGLDMNLVGKTSFEELLVLLKTANLHIDCEGGLVHLRKALNAPPSVVLFGPTSLDFFGYSSNINIKAEDACKIACEWVSTQWETTCIKTKSLENPCMQAITPEMVMEKIEVSFKKGIKC